MSHWLRTEDEALQVVERVDVGHICLRKMVLVAVERMNWVGLRLESERAVRWM